MVHKTDTKDLRKYRKCYFVTRMLTLILTTITSIFWKLFPCLHKTKLYSYLQETELESALENKLKGNMTGYWIIKNIDIFQRYKRAFRTIISLLSQPHADIDHGNSFSRNSFLLFCLNRPLDRIFKGHWMDSPILDKLKSKFREKIVRKREKKRVQWWKGFEKGVAQFSIKC